MANFFHRVIVAGARTSSPIRPPSSRFASPALPMALGFAPHLAEAMPAAALFTERIQPVSVAGSNAHAEIRPSTRHADRESEADSVRELKRNHGMIVKSKHGKVAAYRDADGEVHRRSAICPHMGCIVRWNDAEKTWDCPCHGSRFKATGEVIAGPAETGLAPP